MTKGAQEYIPTLIKSGNINWSEAAKVFRD